MRYMRSSLQGNGCASNDAQERAEECCVTRAWRCELLTQQHTCWESYSLDIFSKEKQMKMLCLVLNGRKYEGQRTSARTMSYSLAPFDVSCS